MNDPFTLNMSATMHPELDADPLEWSIRIQQPWFRALPLSCIERIMLSFGDDAIVDAEKLVRIDSQYARPSDLKGMDTRYWAVDERLQIGVRRGGPIPPVGSLIRVQLTMRMPDTGNTAPECTRRTFQSAARLTASPDARWPLGVCSFSFAGEFRRGRTLRSCLEEVASTGGATALELLGAQVIDGYPKPDRGSLARLSDVVSAVGLVPLGYGGFVDPGRTYTNPTDDDIMDRAESELAIAAQLGCSYARLSLPFRRPVFDKLAEAAERYNLAVLTELHAVTASDSNVQELLGILTELRSPRLGLILDLSCVMRALPGGFVRGMLAGGSPRDAVRLLESGWRDGLSWSALHEQLSEIGADDRTTATAHRAYRLFRHSGTSWLPDVLPFTRTVHGKFFEMQEGREPSIDYADVLSVLAEANFDGYVMSEYEGHLWDEAADTFGQLLQHHRMLAALSNA